MINSAAKTVLLLIYKSLDNSFQLELPKGMDWKDVLELASRQGVSSLCIEALDSSTSKMVPQQVLLQWIGVSELQRTI